MTGTFTVEQLRPIKDGMTISRDAKMGQTTAVTFFSLGKDTSISQERYDVTSIYIGAKGTADFLIGDQAKKEPVSGGDCLIVLAAPSAEWKLLPEPFIQKLLLKGDNYEQYCKIWRSNEAEGLNLL